MGQQGRERPERSLRRNIWKKKPRKLILIACEGKKTEHIYLTGLRNAWHLSTAEIEVVGVGMTPSKVVETVIERKRNSGIKYDETWCVFDHDEHADLAKAQQRADKHRISVALSAPCFEIWYLLHFLCTTRPFQDCDDVVRLLKGHIQDYKKNDDYTDILLPRLADAIRNAQWLRDDNAKVARTSPATDVDKLVQAMRAVADS